jgi:hypothetical protein
MDHHEAALAGQWGKSRPSTIRCLELLIENGLPEMKTLEAWSFRVLDFQQLCHPHPLSR